MRWYAAGPAASWKPRTWWAPTGRQARRPRSQSPKEAPAKAAPESKGETPSKGGGIAARAIAALEAGEKDVAQKVAQEVAQATVPPTVREKSPELQEAEAMLAQTRAQLDEAMKEVGLAPPERKNEAQAKADDYERAWQAAAACVQIAGVKP